ncbi:ferredoxin, 2Fe-2S [Solimonas aquatica]|uniref:Ferredoxin, 2Fe-2S n=1 Tax=Solimonas aquatica TaxID=489703 RepID=A0A1H9G2V1_9GAMM|nr:2Fe-2S iron-sulfur cluster-binding protein [Solimonas aquatica]SEQ44058.1 ferredoxin, 2Fe-2S [Solimonas aquatica]
MSGLKVTFVQDDGVEKVIEDATPGQSLMEIGRFHGVAGIVGDCGGGCACATCHVYVDEKWQAVIGKPDDIEAATLDMVSEICRDNSRLCCQIQMRKELDGLRLVVAPNL